MVGAADVDEVDVVGEGAAEGRSVGSVRLQLDVAREIAPGCVLAVATSTLDAPSGPLQGVNRGRITAVITEQEDRWAITAFQNTLVSD
jgi:hypothetical protein